MSQRHAMSARNWRHWHVSATCRRHSLSSTSAPFNEDQDDLEEILQRDEGRLFPGGGQYERFMNCLHRIVEKYSEELKAFGISPGEMGSHSTRKGSSSYTLRSFWHNCDCVSTIHRWCRFVYKQCGASGITKNGTYSMKKQVINTWDVWYVA